MKFITVTGYYGTGSSAITDLLTEFDEIETTGDYEFRFLQDPDGISDLEFKIVENNHRHNSGHALKRYKKFVQFQNGNKFIKKYNSYLGDKWLIESYKYIDNLTNFRYQGYWHQDVIDKGKIVYFVKRSINKLLTKTIWKGTSRTYNELKNEVTYMTNVSEDEFLSYTRKYINNLFIELIANKEYMLVDQIVASSNISRYSRYFDDIKIFLVERDPRDIYLSEKYIWKLNTIPIHDVNQFCDWYLSTRAHRNHEEFENNVKFIYFEDLIYKYDDTVTEIKDWLNISKHNDFKKTFKPEESINNTKLWDKFKDEERNIRIIEARLKKYLYKY